MKKIFLIMTAITMLILSSVTAFAAEKGNDWSFYFYFADSTDSLSYNERVKDEINQSGLGGDVSYYIGSSSDTDINNFLNFCKRNFDASHKVLVIVGKGEGIYGLKTDEGKHLALSEIKQAVSTNFLSDENDPAFDITMFDASLMATVEMGDILNGYSKYLIAAESAMYDVNGFYLNFLTKFSKTKNKNREDLGHLILDTYAKYIDDHSNRGLAITSRLSLLDTKSLNKAYTAYKVLAKNMLKRIANDNLMLSHISYQSKFVVPMGETLDNQKSNLIDSVDFMNKLKKYFPQETAKVIKHISEALVYDVSSAFMNVTCGVSIYYPTIIFDKHDIFLHDYCNNVACNNCLKALYMYKLNGRIDSELSKLLKKDGITSTIKSLNYEAANAFNKSEIVYTKDSLNFTVKPKKEIKPLIQDVLLFVYKRNNDAFEYYETDSYADKDSKNNIVVTYDGVWSKFNGYTLTTDILADNDEFTEFSTDIKVNDKIEKLYFVYNHGINKIVGVDKQSTRTNAFGTIVEPLKEGDVVSVVNYVLSKGETKSVPVLKDDFIYNKNMKIENTILDDGEYSCKVLFEDLRGKQHESSDIHFIIKGGKLDSVLSNGDLQKMLK